jgi:hypothetical protein
VRFKQDQRSMFQSTGSVVSREQSAIRIEVLSTDGVDAKGALSLSGDNSPDGSKCNRDQNPDRSTSGKKLS